MNAELQRAIVERTRAALPGLRRLVLFGSQARGQADADSDVDLIAIVADAPADGPRTLQWRKSLAQLHKPFDLLVLTPQEWELGGRVAGSAVAAAATEGVELYAA